MEADPFDLARFVDVQEEEYEQALGEIRAGQKLTHWMWFIFPQIDGLGWSSMARRYAIRSLAEARAYLEHPVLGPRLTECTQALLQTDGRSAHDIFGSPDDMKLRSSVTLFASAAGPDSVFDDVLDRFFDGQPDARTLDLLSSQPNPPRS
jgi:uncharacterized protein (DUF1810 family)